MFFGLVSVIFYNNCERSELPSLFNARAVYICDVSGKTVHFALFTEIELLVSADAPFSAECGKRHLRHLDAWLPSYGCEQRTRLQTFVSGKARLKIAMRVPHISVLL